ncbi:MAG: TonB-dependent receptor [Chitinophagaceae bacterium]|nr:TonB-dependent receptor [Chitinophagaceae bacterium]
MKYILLLLPFLYTEVYSQSLSGTVRGNEEPIAVVNISLLKVKDSSLSRAAVTDSKGYYKIENVNPGTYLLSASKIGYNPQFLSGITINNSKDDIELPMLTLSRSATQLNEVIINGKRPFVEQRIDRLVVNVANSIIASGSTALEVLEKAPGIIIDRQNDQIIFRGKEGVIVQIDGKPTYLSMADLVSLLRSMPSDNIDRIELITNPSAKYDAAGNSGIIDIRLKKNNNMGTNGSLAIGLGTGRYVRQRGNIQLNHRSKKLNLFGNYSTNRDGSYWHFDIHKKMPDGAQQNFIEQDSYITFKMRGQNAKAGIDYFINKKTVIGIVWTGFWNRHFEKSPAEARFRREDKGNVYVETWTDKRLSNIQSNHLFNGNINHVFDDKSQLSFDIDLGKFNRIFDNSLSTITIIPSASGDPVANLLSYMPTSIDIRSIRTDYTRTIGKKWKMETGLKASSVKSDNNLQLSQGKNGNLKLDSTLSNHFKYKEEVYAAYLSLSGKLNLKTEVLLGLRAEHTHSIGLSINLQNSVTRNYLNLFPSVFFTRSIAKNQILNFSYSYRIDRPNYQSLNPARSYIDPYAFTGGNPFLKPQFTHSLELKHGFKNKLFTALGASYTSDLVFFVVQPIDGTSTQRVPDNIGASQVYNITFSFPITIMKGWTAQNSVVGIFSKFNYRYMGIAMRREQVSGRLNIANSFVFGKGWTGEMSGRISTPTVDAFRKSPWMGLMDIGIQKSSKNNWRVKLSMQDVFHTNRFISKVRVPEFESDSRITMDTRIVMLNVTYSFGNQQLKNSRQRKTAAEEEVQRTN